MNIKSKLIWGILLFSSTQVFSQDLPKVIPPSPQTSAFFKYQDYPVDYSTGLPRISLPLYEVKSGSLSLPINLNYHSSGRKVYDETGAFGLGWTLNAGGSIARTTYGDADDNDAVIKYPVPWKKQIDISYQNNLNFLAGITNENYPITPYDTEYDVFSYMVNSLSGKFVLRDNNNTKTPVLIPSKPYVVQCHKYYQSSVMNYYDYITITDDKGIVYKFGPDAEISTTGGNYSPRTAWLLSSITSPDQTSTITFKYTSFTKQRRVITQQVNILDNVFEYGAVNNPPTTIPNRTDVENTNDEFYSIQRLTEINFTGGKVLFNLQTGSDVVQNMQVFNTANDLIKTTEFNLALLDARSDGNGSTSKLVSVVNKGKTGTVVDQYSFEYYPTVFSGTQTVVDSRYCDLWGYYNASGQSNMRPYYSGIPFYDLGGLSYISIGNPTNPRNCNLSGTKSGILKKIIYPTGGTSEYIYEQNQYKDPGSQAVKSSGGLRLLQSITDPGSGNKIYKTYRYGIAESGYGNLSLIPGVDNMVDANSTVNYKAGGGTTTVETSFNLRMYSSDVSPIFSYIAQKPVVYTEVAEYIGDGSSNLGKTLYTYNYDDQLAPTAIQSLFLNRDYKYWKASSLVDKTEYKFISNTYSPVKNIHNTYKETQYDSEKTLGVACTQKVCHNSFLCMGCCASDWFRFRHRIL